MITSSFYEVKDMANTITIKNTSGVVLNGVKPGASVKVKADGNGTPLDRYWRNRLRDSGLDGCVEVVAPKKSTSKKKDAE